MQNDLKTVPGHGVPLLFLCGVFPLVSETFIFEQISALCAAGWGVEIISLWRAPGAIIQDSVQQNRLMEMVRFCLSNSGKAAQALGVLRALTMMSIRRPDLLAGLLRLKASGRSWKDLAWLALYAATLPRRSQYAAIVANFGPMGRVAVDLRTLGLLEAPILTYFHGVDVRELPGRHRAGYYASLFARGDLFLIASPHFRDQLTRLGCRPERMLYLPVGINVAQFPLRDRDPTLANSPFQLLTVARLTEKKGHRFVLQAIATVASSHPLTYTIIGDGPLRAALQEQARTLGIEPLVSFLGAQGQRKVVLALEQADAFIQASIATSAGDQEAIPLSLKEAMARGVPVLATSHGGIPQLIRNGENGLLAPEGDAAALAEHILRLIETPDLRARLIHRGRATVQADWDNAVLMPQFVDMVGVAARAARRTAACGLIPSGTPSMRQMKPT